MRALADGVFLDSGDHVLRATKGVDTGLDLDSLVHAVVGGRQRADAGRAARIRHRPAGPTVKVDGQGRTSFDLSVTGATKGQPFWLVLGQSNNSGWTASVDGHDLGKPQLVDGYANGWLIDPGVEQRRGRAAMDAATQRLDRARRCRGRARCCASCSPSAGRAPSRSPSRIRHPSGSHGAAFVKLERRRASRACAPRCSSARSRGSSPPRSSDSPRARSPRSPSASQPDAGAPAGGSRSVRRRCSRVSGLYVLARQAHSKPTAAFEWPAELSPIHQVGWLAVAFLVGLVVVDWIVGASQPGHSSFEVGGRRSCFC